MFSQPHDGEPSTLERPDAIDELFGRANPNAARVGCPPQEVLLALSRRERPLDDHAYEHLTRCSLCYIAVRALQHTAGVRRQRIALLIVAAAAVAVVLLVAVTGWYVLLKHRI